MAVAFTPQVQMPTRPSQTGESGHLASHQGIQDAVVELRTALATTSRAVDAVGGKFWFGTQSAYDAIATKDASTLYVITS
jgi:hypothetical protein